MQTKVETFPIVTHHKVFHVGSLNSSDKRESSLEGAGLSVSLHPSEWQSIAKLGGNPWFQLEKKEPAFLDFHKLTEQQLEVIAHWGVTNGYIEKNTVYFYESLNEMEEELIYEFTSYEECYEEASDNEEEVQTKDGYKATSKLETACKYKKIPPFLVIDLLSTIYVESVLNLDGVWWNDLLDEWNYSAPRGVITLSKLDEWKKTKVK